MTRDPQRLGDYLAHIREAIERISRYTEDMAEEVFLENQLVQDAVIRNFEIIGEASNNIDKHYPDFAAEHPELPLAFAYQMRTLWRTAIFGWISGLCGTLFAAILEDCTFKSQSCLLTNLQKRTTRNRTIEA